ncbi:protein tyrosine phosphatase [Prauserella marina]|uniref:tyrosine-protein phosphatase n=1 Tax=Prauserella marina TaxID=530584 RepID=UPI000B804551|nr:tyrosine-protein phosphatase [Prauserella marina]ASR39144.1 protein tyrosine phosphatase [Prauserella marina]
MMWLELEGAVNIRDVGGIPTGDGGSTTAGRLLRADNLQNLSPSDVSYLVDTVKLTTVVDLRTLGEITSEGPAPLTRVASVEHVHHSLVPERAWDTPDALLARRREEQAQHQGDRTCGAYLGYVEQRPESIVGALRAIASAKGPALVHCAAGKDRTGVVVAFALTVAGALREHIVADYAASGERIEAIIKRLSASRTYAEDVARIPIDGHRPLPETMAQFLDQIDLRYDGVHCWLDRNGFTASEVATLRGRLRGQA